MSRVITSGVVRSTCGLCYAGCGVLVHLDNGKPAKIEGDPRSPVNKGRLCVKGSASLEYLYHPDRLKYPLKRGGNRGEGKWQRISWDEALDIIAEALVKAKDNYGAESVIAIRGAAKGLQDGYLGRLANAFGTPNIASMAPICFVPRNSASRITYGFFAIPDYEYPPACFVAWGTNMAATRIGEYGQVIEALDKGTRLIVIDPIKTELAARADLWVRLRPGSDLAFALGMLNVIINEGLFDKAFVDSWTVGFDQLKAHVQDYPPEKVQEITWVDSETIREVARFYAINKPACIQWGNAIDQNVNSFQTARSISILRAITGNLGVPGGELLWSPLAILSQGSSKFDLRSKLPADMRERRVSAKDGLLPSVFYALPRSILRAIVDKEPYAIRTAYIQGGNLLLSYSNAREVYEALQKLDFLAVADMFMTPTAGLADIVLPVASYLEFDSIVAPPYYPIAQVQQKVAQVGECRSDLEIINELAKKVGLGEYFWDSVEQALDAILKPAGMTFNEFKKIGVISGTKQYRKYEINGFETPSGKVELYSSQLEEWGFDPLPIYYELPETPYSNPELAKEYPLILTAWKSVLFRHSGGRQIATLRGSHPEPVITIHPEKASELGIKEGDWVYIETKRGRIKQKATLSTSVDPRVVGVDYGWWFPEKGISNLYGWAESNVNILTDDKPPYNREMGSTNLRGILCRVYKSPDTGS